MMRILYMGTPEFAAVALRKIHESFPGEVVGVVTRVDSQKNRGQKLVPSDVKKAAIELSLPVFQPENLKKENFEETLSSLAPDLIVVAAYGKILPRYVLDYPRFGCINIHGSILPKYRGAAPIQRAILAGEKEIGVTIMQMEEGIDTGDMYAKASFAIGENDFYPEIHDRLAAFGADLCVKTMQDIFNGTVKAEKQDDSLSNYAKKIEKSEFLIDFTAPAEDILNKIRAFAPEAYGVLATGKVKITKASLLRDTPTGEAGTVSELSAKGQGRLIVNLTDARLSIETLIPQGKKEMTAGDFIRGRRITENDRFIREGEAL